MLHRRLVETTESISRRLSLGWASLPFLGEDGGSLQNSFSQILGLPSVHAQPFTVDSRDLIHRAPK